MESLCAAMLVILSLCGPASVPDPASQGAPTRVLRASYSTDLLGRQVAAAPSTMPGLPWGDPRRLASCAPDGIQRTLDGGQTWSRVPTDGVAALAAGTDMPLAPRRGDAPACQSVALDPREPDAFYAVFEAVKAPRDAPPPWFAAGYVTRDAGQSWQPAPFPPAAAGLQFRGFVADEAGVQVLFAPAPAGPTADVAPPVVLATTDAGQTWAPVPFACPSSGPCIRWGAPPTAIGSCAMHGYGQPLLVSEDDGLSWTSPAGARAANACRPNELVAVSDKDVLLLAPGGSELEGDAPPVRVSHDGGKTFAAVALPEGPAPADLFELHLLPDIRLLARVSGPIPGPGWSWQLLAPATGQPGQASGSGRWCIVLGDDLPTSGMPLRLAGDRIWWLDQAGRPASLAPSDLRCDTADAGLPEPSAP